MWPEDAIRKLAVIMTYAMAINVFFVLVEVFTVLYAAIPEHLRILSISIWLGAENNLAPWMWTSALFAVAALASVIHSPCAERFFPWRAF